MRSLFTSIFLLLLLTMQVNAQDLNELYKTARNYIEKDSCNEATELLSTLTESDYILRDYVLYDLARCHIKQGNNQEARKHLHEIINNYKTFPLIKDVYKDAVNIAIKDDGKQAIELTKDYYSKFGYTDDLIILYFDELAKCDIQQVTEIAKKVFLNGGQHIDSIYNKLKAYGIFLTKEEILKGLNNAFLKKNYRKIIKVIEENDNLDDELKFLLGKAYFSVRNYNAAIRRLIDLPLREAKIILADAFLRIGDRIAAEIVFSRLSGQEEKGLYNLHIRFAELERRENKVLNATNRLKRLLILFPEKKSEILWYLAWLNITTVNYPEAEIHLKEILNEQRFKDEDKIYFWLGKIREYQGQSSETYFLKLKGGKSYYAFKLNLRYDVSSNNDVNIIQPNNLPEMLKTAYLRAESLIRLSLNNFASAEIKTVGKQIDKKYLPLFAKLLESVSDYSTLILLAEVFNNINSYSYPLAYIDYVLNIAKEEDVDNFLVLAVMREESRFNLNDTSVVGAVGLMQLMPDTAFRYLKTKKLKDIYLPENNIKAGIKYLSKLLKMYKNYYYAVAAYNAGEHRVNSWLKKNYKDEDEFVEDIPFGETRNYVKKVMKSYFIYKKLYQNKIQEQQE